MFRFTIRDMLWLTVVVAMGVGLVVKHRQYVLARDDRETLQWQLGSLVHLLEKTDIAVEIAEDRVAVTARLDSDPFPTLMSRNR